MARVGHEKHPPVKRGFEPRLLGRLTFDPPLAARSRRNCASTPRSLLSTASHPDGRRTMRVGLFNIQCYEVPHYGVNMRFTWKGCFAGKPRGLGMSVAVLQQERKHRPRQGLKKRDDFSEKPLHRRIKCL